MQQEKGGVAELASLAKSIQINAPVANLLNDTQHLESTGAEKLFLDLISA